MTNILKAEIKWNDPLETYEQIAGDNASFLLESSMLIPEYSRYSLLGSNPFLILQSKDNNIEINKFTDFDCAPIFPHNKFKDDPWNVLNKLLKYFYLDDISDELPFGAGAVGYLSYDLGRFIENIPVTAADNPDIPDMYLGFYGSMIIWDHLLNRSYITSSGLPYKDLKGAAKHAKKQIEQWQSKLENINIKNSSRKAVKVDKRKSQDAIKQDFTQNEYCEAVNKIRDKIYNGDVYVLNLTQRLTINEPDDSLEVYKRVRRNNPAPMSAYLNCDNIKVVCASPERFLKVKNNKIETRPIKGTRPRGRTPEEDEIFKNELLNSKKERAELLMISDLERNDLGKVCVPGSVKATKLCAHEEYATVHHTISVIEGVSEKQYNLVDILKATFPGGSITGAPKISAMKIIEELEPVRRGIYCGSIGYLAFNGDADLNIVIRSLVFNNNKAYLNVGGGITYDSDPLEEYLETYDKAAALLRALGISEFEGSYKLKQKND